jgi:hypothetical protein
MPVRHLNSPQLVLEFHGGWRRVTSPSAQLFGGSLQRAAGTARPGVHAKKDGHCAILNTPSMASATEPFAYEAQSLLERRQDSRVAHGSPEAAKE